MLNKGPAVPRSFKSLLSLLGRDIANDASDSFGATPYTMPVVGFIGQQKQGKSTLINAILGVDVLPTDSLPATAAGCEIIFGPERSVEILNNDHWQKIDWNDRAAYIDQNLLGSRRAPDAVRIRLPNDLLRVCCIIDTPGTGSRFADHSYKALSTLKSLDLVILVTSLHRPIGRDDLDLFATLPLSGATVIAVINKVDTALNEDEPKVAVQHATEFLTARLQEAGIKVIDSISTSALRPSLGLGDEDGLARLVNGIQKHADVCGVLGHIRRLSGIAQERLADAALRLRLHLASGSNLTDERKAHQRLLDTIKMERAENILRLGDLRRELETEVEAALKASMESAFLQVFPGDDEICEKSKVPQAWANLRLKAKEACNKVETEYAAALESAMENMSAALGRSSAIGSRLLRGSQDPLIEIPISEEPPAAALSEPGFLSEVFPSLHASHVRDVFVKALDSPMKIYCDKCDERYDAKIEQFATALKEDLESEVTTEEREASDRLRELQPSVRERHERTRSLRHAVREARAQTALGEQFSVIADQWRAATDGSGDGIFSPCDELLKPSTRALALAIGEYLGHNAAGAITGLQHLLRTSSSPDREALLARAYWVARSALTTESDVNLEKAVEMQARAADPSGSSWFDRSRNVADVCAFFEQRARDVGNETVHEIAALLARPSTDIGTRAAALQSLRLDPVDFLQELFRLRYDAQDRPPLQRFAQEVAFLIIDPVVHSAVLERLRRRSEGEASMPPRRRPLYSLLLANFWQAFDGEYSSSDGEHPWIMTPH